MLLPRFVLTTFASFLLLVAGPRSVGAATGGLSLTTTPNPSSLVVEPGKTVTQTYRVTNTGQETEDLKLSLAPFRAYRDTGFPELRDPSSADDFLAWYRFDRTRLTIAPGSTASFTLTVTPPATTAGGQYVAVLITRANEEDAGLAGQSRIRGGVAILTLADVQRACVDNATTCSKRSLELESFTPESWFVEYLPVQMRVALTNTGNTHVVHGGSITIKKGDTQIGDPFAVNPDGGAILPESTRTFTASWTDGANQFSWNLPNVRWGRYTAELAIVYDDGVRDQLIVSETHFWVLPWKIILSLALIALVFFIGLHSTAKKAFSRRRR